MPGKQLVLHTGVLIDQVSLWEVLWQMPLPIMSKELLPLTYAEQVLILLTVTHLSIERSMILCLVYWLLHEFCYLLLGFAFKLGPYSLVSLLLRSEHKNITLLLFISYGKSCHNRSQLTELESSQVKNFHAVKPQWNVVILCLFITYNLLFSQIENLI